MKRLMGILLALSLLLPMAWAAAGEDVYVIADAAQVDGCTAGQLQSDRSYLRVGCQLQAQTDVTLSVTGEDGSLVYQRSYGQCSGRFSSEDIFLRLSGSQTDYRVSLQAGEQCYAFSLRRVQPRMSGVSACSAGYPLRSITGADTWRCATVLDLAALEGSSMTVSLLAGDAYEIGTVTFSASLGSLTVSACLNDGVDGSIDKGTVYVASTALEAETLGKKSFRGLKGKLNQPLALSDTGYAAVYVALTVSFDPQGVPEASGAQLQGQEDVWQRMQTETANEAVG